MTYAEKLQHPKWQKKRLQVLNKAKFKCQLCGCSEDTLHVHHKQYIKGKEPWEYKLVDLQCLCKYCHEIIEIYKNTEDDVYKIVRFIHNDHYILYFSYIFDTSKLVHHIAIYSLDVTDKDFIHRITLSKSQLNSLIKLF